MAPSRALVNTNSYDIVHAFNVPSAIAMRCIRAKKRVLSIHGVFSDQIGMIHSSMPDRLVALAESRAIRWADKAGHRLGGKQETVHGKDRCRL